MKRSQGKRKRKNKEADQRVQLQCSVVQLQLQCTAAQHSTQHPQDSAEKRGYWSHDTQPARDAATLVVPSKLQIPYPYTSATTILPLHTWEILCSRCAARWLQLPHFAHQILPTSVISSWVERHGGEQALSRLAAAADLGKRHIEPLTNHKPLFDR